MKPGNLRNMQGAKSGGSVSKDEGAYTMKRSANAERFFTPQKKKGKRLWQRNCLPLNL